MPTKALRPAPNTLSASPVAYWLVPSQMTRPPEARGKQRAGTRRRGKADDVAARVHAGRVARDGGHQHHAFGAQVEHAGAFVDEQPQGGERHHRAGVEGGRDQQGQGFGRDHFLLTQRRRWWMKVSQASSANSSRPWKTPVRALGRPRRDWASSPPM